MYPPSEKTAKPGTYVYVTAMVPTILTLNDILCHHLAPLNALSQTKNSKYLKVTFFLTS